MVWRHDDPCGNEAQKIKFEIVQYTRGKGIDVGCGPHKAFPHFIGIDSGKDTALFNIEMKPDVVCEDAANLDFIDSDSLDFVFSSHLLEHLPDTRAALTDWWRTLKVGGHLVLYLPHRDLYPNIGQPGSNPDHVWDFIPQNIITALEECTTGFDVLVNETRDQDCEYSFLLVIKKLAEPFTGTYAYIGAERPAKSVCVCRFGGFGDALQSANVLPALKRDGFHVTFMTVPSGYEILKHDPHIDAWLIQDHDQVINSDLPLYWAAQAKHFDRFINLSESVEGTLLAFPGRVNHSWPQAVRREVMGKNYLEWTAQLAELPYTSEGRFYQTPTEVKDAKAYWADIKNTLAGPLKFPQRAPDRFNILWCLAGSSVHKFTPHQDTVIANVLMAMPEAVIVLSGDEACQILESGWEDEPRIRCESGKMGIRATLTLAQHADCVVGPETGVLNAVAFEPMGKVIMLSHSSPENLTKHWLNTDTLTPANTACYPCHRLHYGREFCHTDAETGAALCQQDISPQVIFEAIQRHYLEWKTLNQLRAAA